MFLRCSAVEIFRALGVLEPTVSVKFRFKSVTADRERSTNRTNHNRIVFVGVASLFGEFKEKKTGNHSILKDLYKYKGVSQRGETLPPAFFRACGG